MSDRRTASGFLSKSQVASLRRGLKTEIATHPSWPDLWNLQGLLHAYEGDFAGALADFQEAMRINPAYGRARWNANWASVLAHPSRPLPFEPPKESTATQPPELLDTVRAALLSGPSPAERSPRTPALAFALLAMHAAAGRKSEFAATLEALRALDDGIDEVFRTAGLCGAGGPDRTRIAELGNPRLVNPGLGDLLTQAGRMESLAGSADEALRLFALAALFEGNRAAFLLERADLLIREGRHDEVLPLLQEAVEARPDWYQAHLALGYELSVRGVLKDALPHLEKAVTLRPEYPDVQYQYGLLLHAAGRNEEAIRTMERALTQNPSYLVARIALANLLFEDHREADAAPHYARVFEEGIETTSLAGRFGYSLHAAGSRNRAEELFLEAISQDQERPDLLVLYGTFLAETDRLFEARTVWTRALRCEPSAETRERIQALLDDARKDVGAE
jgi:tetratricopeptide (TPR) repeat protein